MLPVNCGSHSDYQNFLTKNLRKYYPDPNALARSTWDIIERFWNLDLSFTDEFMADKYSKFGPAPRTPSCMQRSYLLSIAFKVTSITEWVAQLKINPLYAILSGFEVGDTPGVGTFYDFMKRLWNSQDENLSPHIHPLKTKVLKPKTKGTKADSIEKVTVAELLPQLEAASFSIDDQPYSSLFKIYKNEFLDISVSKGLITPEAIALAGDGTPVVTSHRERKKRICDCAEKGITGCKCDRYFSQPDCDIGWDSSRDCYYHGYDLYMLVASDSEGDLPIFPHFSCASKHDSHGFLHAFFRFKSFLPDYKVSKLLLDSAHDAMPYYEYCKRENITPFIDLNDKGGRPPVYKNDFTIGKDGVPICQSGFRMRRDGTETAKGRTKFKCPKISRKGGCVTCTCDTPCSDAKYGRTVHLVMKDNPRLFNNPPRSSKEWKLEYKARTSVERSNKREKLDFKLEDGRHRSTKMWYCRLYHILMLQHLDAWDLPFESPLKKLILNVA
ncbi:MAG: hypothetical protein PUB10_00040 [Clostridiales bacterium]|nr:hypothetical protein [Clostridiales bacterium]